MNKSLPSGIVLECDDDYNRTGGKDDIFKNGFVRLEPRTHAISLAEEHIPDITHLAADLNSAVQAVWPRRHDIRYTRAHVLLLRWEEDDLGVLSEIQELQHVFKDMYHYDVETYDIPSVRPEKALNRRIVEFLDYDDESDNETLLIVYYAGHASRIYESNTPPLWFAHRQTSSPSLSCVGIQSMLEAAESDVLLLYDCCHSAPIRCNRSPQSCKSVTEAIAACGYESTAAEADQHSFSKALVQALGAGSQRSPFSIAELHTWILDRLKCWLPSLQQTEDKRLVQNQDGRLLYEHQPRRTPIYSLLCETEPRRSILLGPLKRPDESNSALPYSFASRNPFRTIDQASSRRLLNSSQPQILLAIRLEKTELDKQKWVDWIRELPDEGTDIKIEGVYQSFSTLLIFRMPVAVWNLLPENPAYSFIGFVTSDNMILSVEAPIQKENPGEKRSGIRNPHFAEDVPDAFPNKRHKTASPIAGLPPSPPTSVQPLPLVSPRVLELGKGVEQSEYHNHVSFLKPSLDKKLPGGRLWVWYCCQCNHGPYPVDTIPYSMGTIHSCPATACKNHLRCSSCRIVNNRNI